MLIRPDRLGSYFQVMFGLKTPPDNSVFQAEKDLFCLQNINIFEIINLR